MNFSQGFGFGFGFEEMEMTTAYFDQYLNGEKAGETQTMQGPVIMIKQSFIDAMQQVAEVPQPISIKMTVPQEVESNDGQVRVMQNYILYKNRFCEQ